MEKIKKIKILNKEYILKKVEVPFSYKELVSQHKYINYLNKNKINTPKIKFNYLLSIFHLELQEFIGLSSKEINTKLLVEFIAKYHSISSNYKKNYLKKRCYNMLFNCNNIHLKKLLLDFDEKYYNGPLENYYLNKNYISINNRKLTEKIKIKYCNNYFLFKKNYYKENCIIHNDITSNNIIYSDDLYIIDFDLSIVGSIYVDFVDSVLKRTLTLDDILKFLDNKQLIQKYINNYNQINKEDKIELKGVLLMITIKICAYNFYVLLNEKNIRNFEINIERIYKILLKIEGMIKNEDRTSKNKRRKRNN